MSVLSLAALITGCKPADQTPQAERQPTDPAARYEEATKEIVEAADAAGSYAKAQKTVFVTQLEERIAALKSKAEELPFRNVRRGIVRLYRRLVVRGGTWLRDRLELCAVLPVGSWRYGSA